MRTFLSVLLALVLPGVALAWEPQPVKPLTSHAAPALQPGQAPLSLSYGHDEPSGARNPGVTAAWKAHKQLSITAGVGGPTGQTPGASSGSVGLRLGF